MKYPIVLQHSEEDCGAACIATVAKNYGRTFAIARIREAVGTGARGTTLLGLNRGADALGFHTRQVKADNDFIDRLEQSPLPVIIHWRGTHWVVLYGQKGKKYIIADPAVGIRYLTRRELVANWANGVMLLLTPDDNRFYEQPEDNTSGFGKTTQATPQAWQEYQSNYGRLANLGWTTMKLGLYTGTITSTLSSLTNVGLLWMGSFLVIGKTLSIGQLIAYNGLSGNFLGFLSAAIGLVDEFITAQIVIQRLTEVIDATPEDDNDFKKPWAELSGDTDIICSDLNFHHAGRVDLLEDFSLTIPSGKVTALIGKSGCGKSTLAKLISGLYSVQSGNIRYGIYNQQDLSLECLRQQVVLVPQEPHFWSRSIIENFTFSYPDITFEQIVKACQIAGADEFISELPDKYQTVLGEFGANLSGGQKQRLAIARAIITEPPILILDESTGALDPVSEAQVLDRLNQHRKGKTTILISHRPKVIQRADWIVMLEKGHLKIQGSPETLLEIPGEHLDFLDGTISLANSHQPSAFSRQLAASSLTPNP
jgi:ABC-type bacteriocin/lantibiotic exporter with double-glycine peptidase domain